MLLVEGVRWCYSIYLVGSHAPQILSLGKHGRGRSILSIFAASTSFFQHVHCPCCGGAQRCQKPSSACFWCQQGVGLVADATHGGVVSSVGAASRCLAASRRQCKVCGREDTCLCLARRSNSLHVSLAVWQAWFGPCNLCDCTP